MKTAIIIILIVTNIISAIKNWLLKVELGQAEFALWAKDNIDNHE